MSENTEQLNDFDLDEDEATQDPDERCPRGCERFGEWWHVPGDCPTHLL